MTADDGPANSVLLMVESPLQLLLGIVFLALVGFELTAAIVSWVETNAATSGRHRQLVWIPRPATVRDHLALRRRVMDSVRCQYPVLRTGQHAHDLRAAIRGLPRRATGRSVRRPTLRHVAQRPI